MVITAGPPDGPEAGQAGIVAGLDASVNGGKTARNTPRTGIFSPQAGLRHQGAALSPSGSAVRHSPPAYRTGSKGKPLLFFRSSLPPLSSACPVSQNILRRVSPKKKHTRHGLPPCSLAQPKRNQVLRSPYSLYLKSILCPALPERTASSPACSAPCRKVRTKQR